MQNRTEGSYSSPARIALAKKCLVLISWIASEGARSNNPEHIGFALQELSQILFERTGNLDRIFPAISADEITDLNTLYAMLDVVAGFTEDMVGVRIEEFRILPINLC